MKLKEIRTKYGFTQKQLAEKLKIPVSTYNGYEKETFQPTTNTLIKIADFYNISLDMLTGRNYKDIIDKGTLNKTETEAIEKLIELNHDNQIRVHSYIYALWQNQQDENEIIKKVKGEK